MDWDNITVASCCFIGCLAGNIFWSWIKYLYGKMRE